MRHHPFLGVVQPDEVPEGAVGGRMAGCLATTRVCMKWERSLSWTSRCSSRGGPLCTRSRRRERKVCDSVRQGPCASGTPPHSRARASHPSRTATGLPGPCRSPSQRRTSPTPQTRARLSPLLRIRRPFGFIPCSQLVTRGGLSQAAALDRCGLQGLEHDTGCWRGTGRGNSRNMWHHLPVCRRGVSLLATDVGCIICASIPLEKIKNRRI
ncbi:hypothetical protein BC830DRAFT_115972 [Chytriomyces sp. MP71]|nr:hypothetical protein BC830DRAFT_115972 [Chytriomyces sp. MP71]